MEHGLSAELPERFRTQYAKTVQYIGEPFDTRLAVGDSGVVVSISTGKHTQQTVGSGKWPVTVSVSVPPELLALDSGDRLGYLSEDASWGENLRSELMHSLMEAVDVAEIDSRPNTDPDNLHLLGQSAGPASVRYTKRLTFPLDEVMGDNKTVFEVIHRETAATRVCVSNETIVSEMENRSSATCPEAVIIQEAEREASDEMHHEGFNEVVGVRTIESSRQEMQRAYDTQSPLALTAEGEGRGLTTGAILSVGSRNVVAVRAPGFGGYDIHDCETGAWVMRFGKSDAVAHYEHTPEGWEYLGHVSDSAEEKLKTTEDVVTTVRNTELDN